MSDKRYISRRDFTKCLGASGIGLAFAPFLRPSLSYAEVPSPGSRAIEVYIRVYLNGGIDGLAIVPPKHPTLFNALKTVRPRLHGPARPNPMSPSQPLWYTGLMDTPNKVLDIGESFGLHPLLGSNQDLIDYNLKSIHEMMVLGEAKIVPRVGPPVADLNHTTAGDFWNIGQTSFNRGTALYWEVRMQDRFALDPYQLWVLGYGTANVPFRPAPDRGEPIRTQSLSKIGRYQIYDWFPHNQGRRLGSPQEVREAQDTIEEIMNLPDPEGTSVAVKEYKKGMRNALAAVDAIEPMKSVAAPAYFPRYRYPHGTDEIFLDVFRVVKQKRVVEGSSLPLMIQLGLISFDSHEQQDALLSDQLIGINHSIAALRRGLMEIGLWDKTVIQIVSEFGRDVEENPAVGTGHGYGSNLLLIGGALNRTNGPIVGGSGMLPQLSDISSPPSSGDSKLLSVALDPRSVYYEIVAGLGYDPSVIFPSSEFTPPRNYNIF